MTANTKRTEVWTLCVECGPNVRTDEDGCCAMCGATAVGTWLDASQGRVTPAVESEIDKLRAQLAAMTAARDEACDIAATAESHSAVAGLKLARIAELRKVGQP